MFPVSHACDETNVREFVVSFFFKQPNGEGVGIGWMLMFRFVDFCGCSIQMDIFLGVLSRHMDLGWDTGC